MKEVQKNSSEKLIIIPLEIHNRIKKYCDDNGFKISKWCSIQLEKALDNQETNKNAR